MTDRPVLPRRHGFSLVELLVVIAILGILVSLMIPAVQKVRKASNKVACQNNLHNIWYALEMYRDNTGVYPNCCQLPAPSINTLNLPSIPTVLGPFVENNNNVFRCPADQGQAGCTPTDSLSSSLGTTASSETGTTTGVAASGGGYFATYGISYEYPMARFANQALVQVTRGNSRATSTMFLMYDYASFHDVPGSPAAIVVVYLDGHVQ